MVYADLDWGHMKDGKYKKIHRMNPPNIYAMIDYAKVGEVVVEEPICNEEDDIWGYVPDELLRDEDQDDKT